MKIYAGKVSQKTIDYKKKYVYQVAEKVRRGTASMQEIATACDMITWLWKWKVIDREESGRLADIMSDAMEGKYPEDDLGDQSQYFN